MRATRNLLYDAPNPPPVLRPTLPEAIGPKTSQIAMTPSKIQEGDSVVIFQRETPVMMQKVILVHSGGFRTDCPVGCLYFNFNFQGEGTGVWEHGLRAFPATKENIALLEPQKAKA